MTSRGSTPAIAVFAVALCAVGRPTAASAQDAATETAVTAALNVRATATFEAQPDDPSVTYVAQVIVNGTSVGRTPYMGSLVPGRYLVEIEGDGLRASTVVEVIAGKKYIINARFYVPMPEAEKRARQEAAVAEARAAQVAAVAKWEEADAAARDKRKPFVVSGAVLLPVGLGLLIGGMAGEAKAHDEHDKYLHRYEDWKTSTDPEVIESKKADMDEAAAARDANNAMGIAFLVVGSAAVVTGIVVLAVMPKRPPEPAQSEYGVPPAPTFSLAPLVGSELGGLSLDVRF
jgi:hypothetical protein